jgi:MarR family transcriptional regulator, transcriptional regulator for hemolysin
VDPLRNFGFLLKDISRLCTKNFERRASEVRLGLTLDECKALAYLHRNQGVTQAELACSSDIPPMTLMRILDRMEGTGWIERRPDPEDRRAWRLHLTRAAIPALTRIWAIADRVNAESFEGLNSTDQVRLIGVLERIHGNLLTLVEDAGEPDRGATGDRPSKQAARTSTPAKRKPAAVRAHGRARAAPPSRKAREVA